MNNATVTLDYESFQSIKRNADLYENLMRNVDEVKNQQKQFIDRLIYCLEKTNEQKVIENKQFYVAEGIKVICEYYEMDLADSYGELDEGKAPDSIDLE
ncbi:hypothetical protein [Paenibacillus sp. DCT19]|uniref:hypothetical protein n=1 Tax=Paenibacillus sp. DCT19 TaxID=2211212 RepID=UPI000FE1A45D|nr:hypothetical protein [Paenibacillus sp. DCT19]